MPKVEIYTQYFCPYCERAVNLLRQKAVPFEEIDAPQGSTARNLAVERSGGRPTVPQIFINGVSIGGSDELMALNRSGKLDLMLAG